MAALLWALAGLLLGGIVHIVTVLAMPHVAPRTAFARLQTSIPANASFVLMEARAENALGFADPAMATAICRFDLTAGPVRISTPLSPWYTSLSFYDRAGLPFYALNDRAGSRGRMELDLMTPEQRRRLPSDDETTAADRLIVEAPALEGLAVVKAFAPEPGLLPAARGVLAGARCEPLQ